MSARGRIDDIEVLRGVAVLMVLLFHLRLSLIPWEVPWWDHITQHYFGFWPGVDLFFAISGFVIARTLLPMLRAGRQAGQASRALLAFWLRRVWRILPSAWLWLWLMLIQAAFFNSNRMVDTFHINFESTIAGMLSIANLRMAAATAGHFGYGISTHYWSLSLEEQFYVLLPAVALSCGKYLVPVLLALLLVLMAVPQSPALVYFRAHALILGVLLAVAAERPGFAVFEPVVLGRFRGARWAAFVLPMLCITAVAPTAQRITSHPTDVAAVLAVLPVLVACFDKDYIPFRGIARRALLWTGSRSYALYLIHLPAFYATREFWLWLQPAGTKFGPGWGPIFLATAGALLVLLAELNFRVVERPLRQHGARVASRVWANAGDARVA
jgi:peptidoglycan/LPS O-acetylase OafA/YrhL